MQVEIQTATDHEQHQGIDPLDKLLQCLPSRQSVSLSSRFTMPPIQNGRTSIWSVSEMECHDELENRPNTDASAARQETDPSVASHNAGKDLAGLTKNHHIGPASQPQR
jgi:hypothetical protein